MSVKKNSRWNKFMRLFGPGFVSGAADDDPTAIATYTQSGAQFGYGQLWTVLFTIPFMTVVQEMSGRIGMVTGKGLAGVIRKHYPRFVLSLVVILLLVTNIINIGANLGAMAISAEMVFPIPFAVWLILFAVTTLFLEIFLSYRVYSHYLKYLGLFLLSYVAAAFFVKHDWGTIFASTFNPSLVFSEPFFLSLVAILGTNISPYLFFWQASEEVEDEIENGQLRAMGVGTPKIAPKDLRRLKIDTTIGMIFSNLVIFFVAIAAASSLGGSGLLAAQTPADAARALEPLAGPFASLLFSLGIVGSGLLVVPILSGSASYALAESFGWKEGFSRKLKQAYGFYGVIIASTLLGLFINFSTIPPFRMLVYAAALNGLLAPILLILIMLIANDKKIMGKYKNRFLSNLFGVIITLIMLSAGGFLLWSLAR